MKGYLVLENGSIFEGERIGYNKDVICEVVFNTSMTGYLEVFTDPSYAGQGVVMTYPLIGNYGLTKEDQESRKTWSEAVFVHEIAEVESNFRSKMHILQFLEESEVPGLQGVNTRKLTKMLRDNGTMKGKITSDIADIDGIIKEIKEFEISNLVEKVTSNQKTTYGEGDIKIAVLDFGTKQHIINSLVNRNCSVTVFPQDTNYKELLADEFDGIVLSNGPGNPEDCTGAIENIKQLYEKSTKPILGIGLGHQLMGLATGLSIYKLKHGHRGANYPVKDVKTNKICITSQNHGYVIKEDSVKPDIAEVSHININDKTIEGLRYKGKDIMTVQYYPEDSIYDEFIAKVIEKRKDRV